MDAAIRWSPTSTAAKQSFLLADSTGRSFSHATDLKYDGKTLRYDHHHTYRKVPTFRAFDWAPFNESIVAVGQWSGEVTILHIDDSVAPISFPAKHQRLCNAVAFSRDGLLATGLERVRNVECLHLWDINQRFAGSPTATPQGNTYAEPYRKLASSEAIASIKFFNRSPNVMVAGVKSIGLRIYDLRENTSLPSLQYSNARVHNIAIDPMNENYFACSGTARDTTIQVWDSRLGSSVDHSISGLDGSIHEPLLEYEEAFASTSSKEPAAIRSLRYCKGSSNILGALSSDGSLKVFETSVRFSEAQSAPELATSSGSAVKPIKQITTKRTQVLESAVDSRSRLEDESIVSFDFTNLAGPRGNPCTIVLRSNNSVNILEMSSPPAVCSLSNSGSLVVSGRENYDTTNLNTAVVDLPEGKHMTFHVGRLALPDTAESSSLARVRCDRGYGLDPKKNASIVGEDECLHYAWSWIWRAYSIATDQLSTARGLDLSYIGLWHIWNSDLGPNGIEKRLLQDPRHADIAAAIKALTRSLDLPFFESGATDYHERRQLCLYYCGLSFSPQQFDRIIIELARQDQKTKAAALAMIYEQPRLALQALKEGQSHPMHRQLSVAIAASINESRGSTYSIEWQETINSLGQDLNDDHGRVILAIIGRTSWQDMLTDTSILLQYRLGLALRYLQDGELTAYLEKISSEVIAEGQIGGIVLTGFTEKLVPLLQKYMNKQSDLQTAVLMLAFGSPRYFEDPRVLLWRSQYRSQLNSWGKYTDRARFDIQSTKLSTRLGGKPLLPLSPRQVSLRCIYCEKALDRSQSIPDTKSAGVHPESIFGDASSGTVCPKCGRHMPRCVICLKWVGVPDAHTKGAATQSMSKQEALENFINVCQTCWHVSHAKHAEDWFKRHQNCPVPGCKCRCSAIDMDAG